MCADLRRCTKCIEQRTVLNYMLLQHSKITGRLYRSKQSYYEVAISYLTPLQVLEDTREERLCFLYISQHIRRIKKRLEVAIKCQGGEFDDALHRNISATMSGSSTHPATNFLGAAGTCKSVEECKINEIGASNAMIQYAHAFYSLLMY